jgi:hypothetical protein
MTSRYRLLTVSSLLLISLLAAARVARCQAVPTALPWNVSDRNLALLKVPDVVHGDLNDLLLYPTPEFSLPLLQPLTFSAECDCYSLTVRMHNTQRLRVLQLWRTAAGFYRSQNGVYVELEEFGPLKAITGLSGTRYLFTEVGQAEHRCVSVHTLAGNYLLVDYTAAGLISQLRDSYSRTIVPTYQGARTIALTQTWIDHAATRSRMTVIAP